MIYLFLGVMWLVAFVMLLWCAVVDPEDEPFYVDPAKTCGGRKGKYR